MGYFFAEWGYGYFRVLFNLVIIGNWRSLLDCWDLFFRRVAELGRVYFGLEVEDYWLVDGYFSGGGGGV